MIWTRLITVGALILSFAGGTAFAQSDKAKKQDEMKRVAAASLKEFYKHRPDLQARVEKAPGYGLFTTYGLSFGIGGAGGKGVVHDNGTNQDTYMSMARASAGLEASLAQTRVLIVFRDAKSLNTFVTSGWEFGAEGGAGVGAGGKRIGSGGGSALVADSDYFMLTKNGVQAGGMVAGSKFWKDKDLN